MEPPDAAMSRYHVDVIEPTSLLPAGSSGRDGFEAAWSLLAVEAERWRRSLRVDVDGGLFLKGMYVPLGLNPQQFLRRWHIRNEFRNLVALRDLALPKPVPVAWGCEFRLGLPVRSFLVQREIADGVDFADYVRKGGDEAERRAVFRAVGEAVRTLHAAGWIHGDLACRNLMVRPVLPEVILVDLARVKRVRTDRIGWSRRKELYRLVKSADKCGAAPGEVELMLRAAAGDEAEDVIDVTRRLRAIASRSPRKLHTWWWRATGRRLPGL